MSKVIAGVFFMLALAVLNCTPGKETRDPKFQQYYVQGQQLYLTHCSNCHQKEGNGLGRIYPPLDSSDFMDNNLNAVICIIKYGKEGSLLVNGIEYNKPMPGNIRLTELEVAEISTYIYNTWSHHRGMIDVKEVTTVLSTCQQD